MLITNKYKRASSVELMKILDALEEERDEKVNLVYKVRLDFFGSFLFAY